MIKTSAAIFDMDGTLADVRGIRHYVDPANGDRNFDAFHRGGNFVLPNWDVVAILNAARDHGITPLIVTARKAMYRSLTVGWLEKYGIKFETIYMRPSTDDRRDSAVKADILALIEKKHTVEFATDDNPEVIALWEAMGIPVVKVPGFAGEVALDQPIRVPMPESLKAA